MFVSMILRDALITNCEKEESTPPDHFCLDGLRAHGAMPRAVSPLAKVGQHVGSVVIFTEQL